MTTQKTSTDIIGSEGTEFLVTIPAGKKRRYNEILKSANEEGTIQAGDARKLFSRPENHTTMSIARALRIAGFQMSAQ
tara:strand:- start:995 stop:1228 length:234 start_codon:yes stop_codon:yes gene_type:complete